MLAQNQEESQIVVRWQIQGNKGSTNSAEKSETRTVLQHKIKSRTKRSRYRLDGITFATQTLGDKSKTLMISIQ